MSANDHADHEQNDELGRYRSDGDFIEMQDEPARPGLALYRRRLPKCGMPRRYRTPMMYLKL